MPPPASSTLYPLPLYTAFQSALQTTKKELHPPPTSNKFRMHLRRISLQNLKHKFSHEKKSLSEHHSPSFLIRLLCCWKAKDVPSDCAAQKEQRNTTAGERAHSFSCTPNPNSRDYTVSCAPNPNPNSRPNGCLLACLDFNPWPFFHFLSFSRVFSFYKIWQGFIIYLNLVI
jgi:hypothetical protein